MQFQQAPVQKRGVVSSMMEDISPAADTPTTREIPYDYVAKFKLTGNCGKRVQDVINISVEGAFIAVAIGYSFIPAPVLSLCSNGRLTRPSDETVVVDSQGNNNLSAQLLSIAQSVVDPNILAICLIGRLCGIHFKYSIVDSGSGRELQNQPIHNIAGLGEPNGDRPFRPFAKPMVFMPRSTIRIEIQEISEGPLYKDAELQIVLHGYKTLGYGAGVL